MKSLETKINEFKEYKRLCSLPEFIINKRQVPLNQGYIDEGKWMAEDFTKKIQIGIDKDEKPIYGYNTIYVKDEDYIRFGIYEGHILHTLKR